uniref:Uncharacterized protein n=1 Tax=Cannabis sativa TaxID=3483 RepID=A0A803NFI9_CANSA
MPQEIDIFTLQTLAHWHLSPIWNRPFTSHPKRVACSGELVTIGIAPTKPYVEIGVISADGKKLIHRADLKLKRCPICHDIGITKRYNLIMDIPLTIDIMRLVRGGPLIKYDKDEYARIGVMPRYGDAYSIKWFEVEPNCTMHFFNCFEDGDDEIVVWGCRALDSIISSTQEQIDTPTTNANNSYHDSPYEWRLNMKNGIIKEKKLTLDSEYSMDYPTINENYIGLKNKFGYAQVVDPISATTSNNLLKYCGIAKLHFEELETRICSTSGESKEMVKIEYHMFEKNTFCSGATFVSNDKKECVDEDDGWIITFVHNEDTNISQVLLIDSKNFSSEPVAKITLPYRVPYGFHGTFVSIPLASSSPNQAHNQARPSLIPPPSPESPWTCSPLQTPSPSLLYHCIASLHRHDGTIYSVAVSNGVVFTGSDSTRIRAWRPPDCVERGLLKSTSGEVRAILAYGDMLFTSHKDLKIRTWNFAVVSSNFLFKKLSSIPRKRRSSLSFQLFSSKPKLLTERHKDCVSCLAYYHAEGILYTGSHDRTVKAWRVSTRKCVDSFVAHEDNVNGILVNQEDGCVFTCSSDGSVKIWRRIYRENSHTLTMILRFQPSPVNAIALSSSSSSGSDGGGGGGTGFLYSGSSDGTINFWEKERMSYRFNHGGFLQGHRFAVLCVVAVEKMVFSGSEDTTIRIWRREEGNCLHECLAVLDGHRGPVRSVYCGGGGGSEFSSELDRNDSRSSNNQYYYETNNTTSPVLSPSWVHVKKSAQVKHFFQ